MLQIEDALVSMDVIERHFLCDLSQCKGACCIEGDAGAPLDRGELAELNNVLPKIWDDLRPEAQEVIKKQGVAYIDIEGDTVTSIVNGKDCVFTYYDERGICKCAIEKAFRAGEVNFMKPVSCHLYPIRIKQYETFRAVNLDRWSICKPAELLGRQEKLPVYQFLKEPLIRKFGQEWYDKLTISAEEWRKQKNL
ncbi:DUF3109 family protein [Parabacteroides sp. PF5-9]|uniref:DUF3109 family protein n=1 Tax=Parabacteroides sp. PF5-9 TaxID=1742404 RepID=UPI0024758E9B|nr:DUF3109 family protein [Parabacteroides sp. PF5-9]MDH6359038.1 hypothetical protein [Parabacteroides sp. PF5-9]